jgi:hypothetical protein
MTSTDRRHTGATTLLDKILANPLVGLSPWILYALVEGNNRLELSAALALGLALVVLFANWIRGSSPKMLEFSDVVYFAGLAVVVAFASASTKAWLELWGGEVANIALLVIALGSILIRRPFTLQYAREDAPEEWWHEPRFLRVNYQLSWVWVIAFGIEAASGFYGDAVLHNSNNIWTGWIIQTLPLIIAAQFTIWYPNRLRAVRDGSAEAPTVRDFLGTVTPWITIVGIIALFAGGSPEWVGIGLIVVGVVLTRVLTAHRRPSKTSGDATGTAGEQSTPDHALFAGSPPRNTVPTGPLGSAGTGD